MSIYKTLPLCYSTSGPEEVDGVGNFYLHVLAPAPSQFPVITLYFFDSHGEVVREAPFYDKWSRGKEYDRITPEQVEWFRERSQANRTARKQHKDGSYHKHSLAFMHIPPPKFADDSELRILSGRRREPTEGSSEDSGLYDALADAEIQVLACGHDHVNDFVARPRQVRSEKTGRAPWLVYSGTVGYGGYCSYGGTAFHRRARVYHSTEGRLTTWLQVQYQEDPVDNIVLVEEGEIVDSPEEQAESRICVMS